MNRSSPVADRLALILILLLLLLPVAAGAQELRMVPVALEGATVRLAMRVYTPAAPGPAPTLVFHHGSTGRGTDPNVFTLPPDAPALARFFLDRGWAVVMPLRRGRGGSEGLYDEGFDPHRAKGYSCDPARALPGADRALEDIDAAMTVILAMPFVDPARVVIGGQSRGGILAVAYAGRHPEQVRGVINFVGGWLGTGCPAAASVNETLALRGAPYRTEMLWLYGDRDPFYPLVHARATFAAFTRAGGTARLLELPPPPRSRGHVIPGAPGEWSAHVAGYLGRLGLPATPR